MGAWGYKSFENDVASDWVYDIEKTKDKSLIVSVLKRIADSDGYYDANDCVEALAAAEIVAASKCGDHSRLSDETKNWLVKRRGMFKKTNITFDSQDELLAMQAVKAIKHKSELKDLWEDTEDYSAWQNDLDALCALLK